MMPAYWRTVRPLGPARVGVGAAGQGINGHAEDVVGGVVRGSDRHVKIIQRMEFM
jgi:hypothetical protein